MKLTNPTETQLRELAQQQGLSTEAYIAHLLNSFTKQYELQTASESQLLAKLGLGFSEHQWERYHQLVSLRQAERLTEPEYQELHSLTDQLEQANAARMDVLAELAKRRNLSLPDVMLELGIASTNVL